MVFSAPEAPGHANENFCNVNITKFIVRTIASTFSPSFKKFMGWMKYYWKENSFFATLSVFLPPGEATSFSGKNNTLQTYLLKYNRWQNFRKK